MQSSYNVYRMKNKKMALLEKKMQEINLIKQKSQMHNGYKLTFYFSEDLKGNSIWWYKTYFDFFKDGIKEPTNRFYYGLLLIEKSTNHKYIVSLGKSHFYLNKIIESDFGINVAMHIAQEDSFLMKKSRFFFGAKKNEITSYVKFEKNNYVAGESVDHLKAKAVNEDLWGNKNIIFADSIQMDLNLPPSKLVDVIENIESSLKDKEIISLPKMEKENDNSIIKILDTILSEKLMKKNSSINISDFEIFGVEICFSFLNYDYEIYYWNNLKRKKENIEKLGSIIDIKSISTYFSKLPTEFDINNVKIRFLLNESGRFTRSIKEILDIHISLYEKEFALRNGEWFLFNQVFIDYLKKYLEKIPFKRKEDFVESKYLLWKKNKEKKISNDQAKNKLTYPEYYFNEMQVKENGYELMDRECESIKSLKGNAREYRVEIADLYLDETVFAVKIGESDKAKLIYNIEQAKDSIILLKNKTIKTNKLIKKSCLWFVLNKKITKITDINSVQFLLSIESWRQTMLNNNIETEIYYSFRKK